ncbi:hypothetical protein MNAN1_001639 [Malassezia nana]|uniref:Bromo domain-containing protein n=1 Tax=Malassezia nana TaxID=180528 RepID=A0AAF0EQ05_9BASI|nr:hypothetical protein MNAN1_001639 [Malassezia nana]
MPTLTLSKASGASAQGPSSDEQVRKGSRTGQRKESQPPTPTAEDIAAMGRKIVDRLVAARDVRDGEPLSEPFMRLPSRKQYPDYYVVIRRPMTLSEVRTKLKQKEYPTWSDLKSDLELICTNAKRFNMRDSDIWLKARDLHSMIKDLTTSVYDEWLASRARTVAQDGTPSHPAPDTPPAPTRSHKITLRAPRTESKSAVASPEPVAKAAATPAAPAPTRLGTTPRSLMSPSVPTPTTASYVVEPRRRGAPRGKRLKVMLRWIIQSLMTLQDDEGHLYVDMFTELPSRDEYPDYYQFVKEPISLAEIERKLDDKEYVNPHALVSDVRLMLRNAQFYNEEGSQVWNDAEALQQHLERVLIPALLAEGFTLDPNDHRQAALPVTTSGAPSPSESSTPATPPPPPKPSIVRIAQPPPAAPPPSRPPAAAAPPLVPPAPPTLDRVLKDMASHVWPQAPASWRAPPACISEAPRPPAPTQLPCAAVQVRVHRAQDVRSVQLAVDRVQHHTLRLPPDATRTEWHFSPREAGAREPTPHIRLDGQALAAEWLQDQWMAPWDVQPGIHVLEAQWPSEAGHAAVRVYVES